MPNTLIPIQTYTLTSSASSITFSNIPQNYTDLKIVMSGRGSTTSPDRESILCSIKFNSTATTYTSKWTRITSTSASSFSGAALAGYFQSSSFTSLTFSNSEIYITNYTGSQTKSYSMQTTVPQVSASYDTILGFGTGNWSGTGAITQIDLTLDYGSLVSGSTFTLYGVSNGVKATGGTLTVAGGYAYHTFTSTGSFLPSQQIKGAEILAIAGGGGGGFFTGGGGGAGGVLYSFNNVLNAGNSYTALVGAGGSGGSNAVKGVNGTNSVFSSYSAIGGGGGSSWQSGTTTYKDGAAGGSGGGGGESAGAGTGGAATQGSGLNYTGYGNAGGDGYGANPYLGGGGGGAGAVGTNGSSVPGPGGVGSSNWSSWHSVTNTGVLSGGVYYIAGGGGAVQAYVSNVSSGGVGGGGAGVAGGNGTAGTANTGGGAGAGGGNNSTGSGGTGGSGLIIVRYRLD